MAAENNNPQAQELKSALDESGLPDTTKIAVVRQWFGDAAQSSDRNSFANGINSIPNVPPQLKLRLMQLRFGGLGDQAAGNNSTDPPRPPQSSTLQQTAQLPSSITPESFVEAVSTPLTEQLGIPTFESQAKANTEQRLQSAAPWEKPLVRFAGGVDEAVAGAADQLTAPLSILLAPLGAAENAGSSAVKLGARALRAITGAMNATDATRHAYNFFRTGDTGEAGKAAVELPMAYLGVRGKEPGIANSRGKTQPETIISTEPAGPKAGERLAIEGHGAPPKPPSGAISLPPIKPDYKAPVQYGETFANPPRPLGLPDPEPRVLSPEASFEDNLQMARQLPPEVLERNIEQMRMAAAQHAGDLVQAAGKDKTKQAEAKEFIQQAKARIEQFEKILKPESASAEKAAPEKKTSSNIGPAPDAGMVAKIDNQFQTAKSQGIKTLKLTLDRPAKEPLVINVNTESDTPQSIAAQIAKAGGAEGMARIEGIDRPLQWKFMIGNQTPPPGSK